MNLMRPCGHLSNWAKRAVVFHSESIGKEGSESIASATNRMDRHSLFVAIFAVAVAATFAPLSCGAARFTTHKVTRLFARVQKG